MLTKCQMSQEPRVSLRHSSETEGLYYLLAGGKGIGPEAVRGAIEVARRRRIPDLVLHPYTQRADPLLDHDVLGVLSCIYDRGKNEVLRKQPYPVLNLSNSAGPIPDMGNLLSDDRAVGRMAARHLIERGHRSFLTVWYEGRIPHRERAEGFLETIRAAGLPVLDFPHSFQGDKNLHKTHLTYIRSMREIVASALEKIPLGTGIFVSNDELALLLQQVMHLSYPEHLDTSGLLGVDNDAPVFGYYGMLPELSSVQPAFRQMGADAMDWLCDHPGPEGREAVASLCRRYPPVSVIARASTAAGACADPLTARMIRWIWEQVQAGRLVTVTELARTHHLARKTLERRFAQHAGCSPGDLIQRLRLDLARDLLRNSRLSIAEISLRCGFAKQDVLSRALRAADGCTPREYRVRVASGELTSC